MQPILEVFIGSCPLGSSIEAIVSAYVRLKNRQALENMRELRQQLLEGLQSTSGIDASQSRESILEDLQAGYSGDRDRGRCLHRGRRRDAYLRSLIYLKLGTPHGCILPAAGHRAGATMQPWILHALAWGLTAVALATILSMALAQGRLLSPTTTLRLYYA